MRSVTEKYLNRREFIKTCLRFTIGGGLVSVGFILGQRKKVDEDERDCTLKNPCQSCSKYAGCNLPRAESYRIKNREA
jgi:hypothetical protein